MAEIEVPKVLPSWAKSREDYIESMKKRAKAQELYFEGYTCQQIAKQLGVYKQRVYRWRRYDKWDRKRLEMAVGLAGDIRRIVQKRFVAAHEGFGDLWTEIAMQIKDALKVAKGLEIKEKAQILSSLARTLSIAQEGLQKVTHLAQQVEDKLRAKKAILDAQRAVVQEMEEEELKSEINKLFADVQSTIGDTGEAEEA